MARLVYVVTSPLSTVLLRGQLAYFREQGHEVTLVTAHGAQLDAFAAREGITIVVVPLERAIRPAADLKSLVLMIRALRRLRPDVVNASTPKAGLIGMLAARCVGVPVRVYTLRGLRLETSRGLRRRVLGLAERITSSCAHRVVCVSESLRLRYVEEGLAPAAKTQVLGHGSSNGIDCSRSKPDSASSTELRTQLGIPSDALVIGFVGRLTRDKGVADLLAVFETLSAKHSDLRLLVVGPIEDGDPVSNSVIAALRASPHVVLTGFVDDPMPYYSLLTVLAFPSHREGFPNAPLEAAAAGVPTVGFATTGTVDAIDSGTTGVLVPLFDRAAMAAALDRYLSDPALARSHGQAGRARALQNFRPEPLWRELGGVYSELLTVRRPVL
jgi:glycosyltransferase involved in cell wall biosynthesis